MDKFERLIKALRGNDRRIAEFERMSDGKAYRMFALGCAIFLSAVLAIGVQGWTGSSAMAAYMGTAGLAMFGPLGIIFSNRYLNRGRRDPDGILSQKQILVLDFQEELRMIDEMKLSKKETFELRKQTFEEFKVKRAQIENALLRLQMPR